MSFLLEEGKLSTYSYKWESIALAVPIGFQFGEVKGIDRTNRGDVQACMTEMLNIWSSRHEDHKKQPTLENLCAALRSQMIGLGAVASDLQKIRTKLPSLQNSS